MAITEPAAGWDSCGPLFHPVAMIGPMSGEISIAPMIMGGLISTRPKLAMPRENKLQPAVETGKVSRRTYLSVDLGYTRRIDSQPVRKTTPSSILGVLPSKPRRTK